MIKDFRLESSLGNIISISANGLENIEFAPCLIYVHGFKGFKDWGFIPFLSDYFANEGYFVLTFNFSHNGIGSDNFELTEKEKFAKNTISLEVSELVDLINAYLSNYFGKTLNQKIGIIGHSRGGAVTLLSANKIKVDSYAVWASIAKIDRYTSRMKKEWREKGFIEVINSRTNQMMKLDVSVLDDIEGILNSSFDLEHSVENLERPLLIVQGEEDLTVPITEAEMILNWSNKEISKLVKIPNTGHTFDVVHPFVQSTPKFEKVLDETNKFFQLNLKS